MVDFHSFTFQIQIEILSGHYWETKFQVYSNIVLCAEASISSDDTHPLNVE